MDRRTSGVHIATQGWHFPDDASGLFPEDLPADWLLSYYTTQLHALELPPVTGLPDPETVAFWAEETLEDAALSLPLAGEWTGGPAGREELRSLAALLEPLGDKLAVLLWPQKPPIEAPRYWPGTLHLDAGRDIVDSADPSADAHRKGTVYRRLSGPGRYPPATLEALAGHLVERAGREGESFVVFTDTYGGRAALDAMLLQEAVDRALQVPGP